MTKFINLTPHALNIVNEAHAPVLDLPPSGAVARVTTTFTMVDRKEGVPIYTVEYGEVVGLPEPEPDTIYIVSGMIKAAPEAQNRSDVVKPGPLVRNEAGQVIGCVGLSY